MRAGGALTSGLLIHLPASLHAALHSPPRYRAPELLVGDDTYGPEVDMWAIACIMGELADGDPLFPGDSEIDQLYVIQKMLGPITKPHMRTFLENPRFMGLQFPDMSRPDTLPSRYSNIMSGKHLRFMGNMVRSHCSRCV